jgi:hypothetical protein
MSLMPEDTKALFAVELQDQVSAGALSAVDALEQLQAQMNKDTKALADMQKAMRALKGATTADVKAPMEDLTKRIKAQKDAIASSQGAYVAMGGEFGKTGKAATGFRAQLAELQKAAQAVPGPIGGMMSKLDSFVSKLDAGTIRTVALGAAFLGVAAAAAVFTKSLFEAALASGDAARNELLHFEALTKMRNMLDIAPGKASDMQSAVDKVSASVSISREKVSAYAEQLYRAGLRGANLTAALEGSAIKASALGDAAGSGFAGWAASMNLAGGSVKRLSDDVKNRFGGIVQRQMSSLAVQQQKQKENWASLFRGINVEPFLDALKRLRDILSVNTAAGQALKGLFTTFLQPLFNAAESSIVFMRRFFKQMLIGALELKIAYQDVRNWFARTFGRSNGVQVKDLIDKIQLGRVFVYMLAAAFGVLAVSVLAATWPFVLGAVAIYGLIEGMSALYDLWNEIDWSDLGRSLWKGIVDGLEGGWKAVKSVFSDLAHEAAKAFKVALGIASPSKVFAELGYEVPAGVAKGIQVGTPVARQAAADMVQATTPKLGRAPVARQAAADMAQATTPKLGRGTQAGATAADQPPGAARTGNVTTLTIGEVHVHAGESSDPKALAVAFRRELESVLEGVSLELGAPPLGARA